MVILTVKDVSALLQVKPSTIYAWAEQRLMPSFKINGLLRFSEEDIIQWINRCKMPSNNATISYIGRRPMRKEDKR